ncbi:vesicle coat component [Linderina macrospora]|uniref:Vesicle coat component n=1 Tax=Linderina macrospora TaxID=4868 RepID=A0ACC1IZN0_9FUNG|nr:vesicle coat component [Linderina macrospora]
MKTTVMFALLALLVAVAATIEFDLTAGHDGTHDRRCLSQWLPKGVHVKVATKVLPGFPGQTLNMEIHDDSPHMNQYGARKHVDEVAFRFDTQAHANVIVCFQNVLDAGQTPDGRALTVQFKMNSGADAEDFGKLQSEQKLKPMEIELRRLAMHLEDVQDTLQYLKEHEGTFRDANEYMNARVKNFGFFSIAVLIGVAVYQVLSLRRFFHQKKLI